MPEKRTSAIVILSVAFLLVTIIGYSLDLQIADTSSTPKFFIPYKICSIFSLLALFGLTIYLFTKDTKTCVQEKTQLEEKLATVTDTLNDVQSSLDDAVEKKTFEMSVINGSLNREIAERIQAESEGVRLRRRLQAILNSAGDGIFGIDTKGVVTFSNHKATELLGWSQEELIGKSHHDLVHHTRKSGLAFPVEECPIYMAYKDGQIHFETDDVFWTKNNDSFPVEYTSTPLLDGDQLTGAVVVFKDITKSNKLQKQLELILESAGEGIFGLDVKGNVTFMNKAASIMLGWSRKDLIGKSLHGIVHHSHADGEHYTADQCPIYRSVIDGQVHFKSDDVFWTREDHSFAVEYTSTPIFEEKVITGAVVVFRDLTTFS